MTSTDNPPRTPIGYRLLNELGGLLRGIAADAEIVPIETDRVRRWLEASDSFRLIRPFSEIAPKLDTALADAALSLEECEDILFVVDKLTTVNPHFDAIRSGLQELLGVLAGIGVDGIVKPSEVERLRAWLASWAHLRGLWPFDECESVVASILSGGGTTEIPYLLALGEQFPIGDGPIGDAPPTLVAGVCAVNPTIVFEDRFFVFTGESSRAKRKEMEALAQARAAKTTRDITKQTHYLIVCDCGSPHWAFSCFGRKIERAYEMRRDGHPILIVHEHDFWSVIDVA